MTAYEVIALTVAGCALIVSATNAWLTLLKPATVKMTQPTVVYFGPDAAHTVDESHLKIYMRTLLYATAQRGCIIESMFIRIHRGETTQNFNIWVLGEERLMRGSGLFVPAGGVTMNHHFLLPWDGTMFSFVAGMYQVEVFAAVVGERSPRLLKSISLTVTPEQAKEIEQPEHGLYFDWSPEGSSYHSHVRVAKAHEDLPRLLRGMLD